MACTANAQLHCPFTSGSSCCADIPSLVVAAACFDDVVALALYTIFISRAVYETDSILAYSIPAGPLNVVFGLLLGAAGAAVCSATKLWDSAAKRTLVVLLIALLQMYFMVRGPPTTRHMLSMTVSPGAANEATSLLWHASCTDACRTACRLRHRSTAKAACAQPARAVSCSQLARALMQVHLDFSGAGILSAIVLGVATSTAWDKGWPGVLSSGARPST